GILMAIGEFMILGGTEALLYVGMGTIIVGNGYFKANISSIVGKLYKDGDPKRDSGFTIFYIGINIGALLATTVCAQVGETFGYEYGFGLAGIGMIAGVLIFVLGSKHYEDKAKPPDPKKLHESFIGPLSRFHVTILGSLAIIPVLYLLIALNGDYPFILIGLLLAVFCYVCATLVIAGAKDGKIGRDKMIAMLILLVFNIVFWSVFEQAGTSLTLFAKRNVDRMFMGMEVGASVTQAFNPAYIIIFGSLFAAMWVRLDKIGKNPNIPLKFGFGVIQVGLGFLVVILGGMFIDPSFLVPLWTLAFLYLLHTTGELFLSPIGLSMVTKLAPKKVTGFAMGGWFMSFAMANYLAAVLASMSGIGGHGGGGDEGEKKVPTYAEHVMAIEASMAAMPGAVNKVIMSAKDLEANINGGQSEDEAFKGLPAEITQLANGVVPAFQKIQGETFAYLKDSTKYSGEKKLHFHRMIGPYADGIANVNSSLEDVAKWTSALAGGAKYDTTLSHLSGAILGVSDGFGLINKKVTTPMTKFNEGFELKQTSEGFSEFGAAASTASAHMTWDQYRPTFVTMGLIVIGIGIFLCLISGVINRLMHGVT
ncbi:MAG: peptide MFS transporter, partial [Bacteroidota bacterium]